MDDLQSSAFKSGEYIELQEKISANSDKFPDLRIADGLLYRRSCNRRFIARYFCMAVVDFMRIGA